MDIVDKKEDVPIVDLGEDRNITFTLTSQNKNIISQISKEFNVLLEELDAVILSQEVKPVHEACFNPRKSPCGNGTATFSRIKLMVYEIVFTMLIKDAHITKLGNFLKTAPVKANLVMNPIK